MPLTILLVLSTQVFFVLKLVLHGAISLAMCVATPLRPKLKIDCPCNMSFICYAKQLFAFAMVAWNRTLLYFCSKCQHFYCNCTVLHRLLTCNEIVHLAQGQFQVLFLNMANKEMTSLSEEEVSDILWCDRTTELFLEAFPE